MKNKTLPVLLNKERRNDAHLGPEALKESFVPSFIFNHGTRGDEGLQKMLQESFDLAVMVLALPELQALSRSNSPLC